MLYGVLRIIFWGAIFAFTFLLIVKRTKIAKKKSVIIASLALCIFLGSISALFPVENLFINFESPESVLHYYQNGEAKDTIYGRNSCMIIYSERGNLGGYFIVPKSAKGYKIPSLFSVRRVAHRFDQEGNFSVYNVLGTNDYYIIGSILSKEKEISITDSNNNAVQNIVMKMGDTDTKTILIYTFVDNHISGYFLLINGKRIVVLND